MKVPIIGIGLIFNKHYDTLKKDIKLRFIALYFLIIPFFFAGCLILYPKILTLNSTNALITSFSIFTGLLLNIIMILYAIINKNQLGGSNSHENDIKDKLLSHLYANSIYALLLSTLILFILMIVIINDNYTSTTFVKIISYIVFFLVSHFVITLLMIFRRLFVLLFSE